MHHAVQWWHHSQIAMQPHMMLTNIMHQSQEQRAVINKIYAIMSINNGWMNNHIPRLFITLLTQPWSVSSNKLITTFRINYSTFCIPSILFFLNSWKSIVNNKKPRYSKKNVVFFSHPHSSILLCVSVCLKWKKHYS